MRILYFVILTFLGLAPGFAKTPYCYSRLDGTLLKYGSLGRDLSSEEIARVRRDTVSCAFVERRHVAAEVINALGRILLHATSSPRFQRTCLDALYKRNGIDVNAEGYAELRDAVAIRNHQQQLYGSFPSLKNGRFIYGADKQSIDAARSVAGLLPLKERISALDEAVTSGNIPLLWQHELALTPAHYPADPVLRLQVMRLAKNDQLVRSDSWRRIHHGESQTDAMRKVDAENLPVVRKICQKFGFPDADEVGRNGVVGFFLLIQHASNDVGLMNRALSSARPLYLKGDLPPVFFALLTDRVRILNRKPQIYGSQGGADDNGEFIYPIQDPINVNSLRAKMFMSPLSTETLAIQRRWPIK